MALTGMAFFCPSSTAAGGDWHYSLELGNGTWRDGIMCDEGSAICGLQTRVLENQYYVGDDFAMSGVHLFCCANTAMAQHPPSTSPITLEHTFSGGLSVGVWRKIERCPQGEIAIAFKTGVEAFGNYDNTALNGIMLQCSGGTELTSHRLKYGYYANAFETCTGGYSKAKLKIFPQVS